VALSNIDLGVLVGYLLLVTGFGLYMGRREKNTADFFLGGKSIPWWAIFLSILATEASALTFIGVPGTGFGGNWTYIQLVAGTIIARFILARLFLKPFYDHGVYTPYDYLGIRFGPRVRDLGVVLFLISRLLASGVRLFGELKDGIG